MDNAHALSVAEVARRLETDLEHGLSDVEFRRRLADVGPNELPPEKKPSVLLQFLKQFKSGLIAILLVAAAVSLFVGEAADAVGIFAALLVNAVIGFLQERRAETAVAKLREMVVQEATVIRDGRMRRLPATQIVPGDLLLLAEGDRIAADVRLVAAKGLSTVEGALTGESNDVKKAVAPVAAESLVPDRSCMAWMGTTVASGEGRGIVVETGGRTAFGRIAASLVGIKRGKTPLEHRLDKLGRQLGFFAVVLSAVIMALGTWQGADAFEMFLFSVALMVSVVPEGLPAVLAIVLAIGVQRMARRKAIMRHMPSVETLGITDVICTDKTGTLTENKMTVREVAAGRHRVRVSGEGWDPRGEFLLDDRGFRVSELPELDELVRAALLCNKAILEWKEDRPAIVGDPTEGALTVMAAKAGYQRTDLMAEHVLIDEIPFSSDRKYRAMLYARRDLSGLESRFICVVGAYGTVRDASQDVRVDGVVRSFDAEHRAWHDGANDDMASRTLRVLGVAVRTVDVRKSSLDEADVAGLTFLGSVGMIDPPRAGIRNAVERCRRAGIRVLMLTGDQKATALAIGRDIGLVGEGDPVAGRVHTEKDVAAMGDAAFAQALKESVIFARVTPETKLRVVAGLRAAGHVVAMTGDGVNDAPALKRADIGVAMGITGTDVTKEVADMVLADDNFVSIVNAVEEGRNVFGDVQKTASYLFMTNAGEICTIFASILAGLPLPLLPTQILWMNLVTDSFPAVALATEPAAHDALDRPPRRADAPIISRNTLGMALVSCLTMSLGTLALFAWALTVGDLAYARTVAFTAMAAFQLWNVFNMRSMTASLGTIGLFGNRNVIYAVAAALGLQLAVIYVPFLQPFFGTVPIGLLEWLIILVVTASVVGVLEAYKSAVRKGAIPASWM